MKKALNFIVTLFTLRSVEKQAALELNNFLDEITFFRAEIAKAKTVRKVKYIGTQLQCLGQQYEHLPEAPWHINRLQNHCLHRQIELLTKSWTVLL